MGKNSMTDFEKHIVGYITLRVTREQRLVKYACNTKHRMIAVQVRKQTQT